MARIVALLDSMWGWGGYNEPGSEAPRFFRINPDNHSGRRLYQLCGNADLLVTNCCRTVQTSANHHGEPDFKWTLENLVKLRAIGALDLLLVSGRVAQDTFERVSGYIALRMIAPREGSCSLPGMGADQIPYLYIDHPAARRWTRESIQRTAERIAALCPA